MWIGECSLCCFLTSTISSFVLLTLREGLFSCHHYSRALTSSLEDVSSLLVNRPTTVVSSVNLMIELEACVATQSWVNREDRRGLSTNCCGAPVLRISEVEVLFPTFTTWGLPFKKSRTQLHRAGFRPRAQSLINDELGWYYGVKCLAIVN